MRVIVLGAGVIGTTTAYFLTRDGHEVTVIDRQEGPGLETSFANGGFISKLTAQPWAHPKVPKMLLKNLFRDDAPYLFRLRPDLAQWIWAIRFLSNCNYKTFRHGRDRSISLAKYSSSQLEIVRSKEKIEYDRLTHGLIELYPTDQALISAYELAKQLPDNKDHPEILDMRASIDIEPALSSQRGNYAGTLFYRGEETGDAYKFTVNLSKSSTLLGTKFRYGEIVTNILMEGPRASGVVTNKGTYKADAVVICLGSFSYKLLNKIGIKVPIFPLKGYSTTLDIDNHNYAPTHGIHDITKRIVLSRLGNRLRCAGTAELTGFDSSINKNRANSILEDSVRLFPGLGNSKNAKLWTGLRPMTPDCLPIIGKSSVNGLYLNSGHGSLGWTWCCGSGRIISDIIKGNKPDIDISGFIPERF